MHIELARFGTELKDGAIAERDHFPALDRLLHSRSKGLTAVLDLVWKSWVTPMLARP